MTFLGEWIAGVAWRPGISDFSWMAWVSIGLYTWGAYLCLRMWLEVGGVAVTERDIFTFSGRRDQFWFTAFAICALLGLNKPLDIQTLVAHAGRSAAKLLGWYGYKGALQTGFVLVCGVIVVSVYAYLWTRLREHVRDDKWAYAGIGCLFAFALLRAASFHDIDILLASKVSGIYFNYIIEWTGILLVIGAARRNLAKRG